MIEGRPSLQAFCALHAKPTTKHETDRTNGEVTAEWCEYECGCTANYFYVGMPTGWEQREHFLGNIGDAVA